jgi:hypothetical protein
MKLGDLRDRLSGGPSSDPKGPRVPQQVTRLAIVFAIAIAALIAARIIFVPPTFGDIGHYRAAAIGDVTSLPIKYAAREICADCHPDEAQMHSRARHQTVACETCHGPSAAHMGDPTNVKPIVPRERAFCPQCHGYDPSRPTGFPQIEPLSHNPMKPCFECHVPHAPEPPTLPSSCSACHGEIARLKAASHHATLECTQCHNAPDAHRDTPRLVLPDKPRAREFCGGCHATDAKSPKQIPRIDLATHGGRYLCWQCHYPHYPEVG